MNKSKLYLLFIAGLNIYLLYRFIQGITNFNYPNSGISVELFAVEFLAFWMVINVILFVIYLNIKKFR